jgi:ATP-dependent Clp protease ATP-binding subunit ClpB
MNEESSMSRLQKPLDPRKMGSAAVALDRKLRKSIVGQDDAITQIVSVYQMYLTRLTPSGRPIGNFLFLGPTGTGKTRTVEAVAEALAHNPGAVIKIDCAEFQHSHEIAKLIGSPPGYLGHRETHPFLSQEVLDRYHTDELRISFLLFDEIEKASDALWNLLLGILDKATMTLGDNRKVDFSQCMIFLTSNLGSAEMESLVAPRLGFQAPQEQCESGSGADKLSKKLSNAGIAAARRKFTPEFMNRIDKVVTFKALGRSELRRVLDIELSRVQDRILALSAEKAFVFSLTPAAKDLVLSHGVDARYGARHLKRALDRLLVQPLSNLMASDQITCGDRIEIDADGDAQGLTFHKQMAIAGRAAAAGLVNEKAAGLAHGSY